MPAQPKNAPTPKIPRGWRRLRVGAVLRCSDHFLYWNYDINRSAHCPTAYEGYRAGEWPNKGTIYIRRQPASPKCQATRGGRKGRK